MDINNLRKYKDLYKSSEAMGAAKILRDYLNLGEDFPIPLSISHGVDMNQCPVAMDVNSVEPIHWSCNQSVHERASKVKPSVRLPHPWLMLKAKRPAKLGKGILVIGPPPGISNDLNLLNCLKRLDLDFSSCHLLLKFRGATDSSRDFWEENGIRVVTAGEWDNLFYDRLFSVIERYECVIGCTLSSAIFFAASIGKECRIIEDYTYSAYDVVNYLDNTDFGSDMARKFSILLKDGDQVAISTMALNVLGVDFIKDVNSLEHELLRAIEDIQCPVHFVVTNGEFERLIILWISKLFGRSGLIRYGFFSYFKARITMRVSIIKINEFDAWISGVNEKNCDIKEVKYVKNKTEPGWAVD